MVDIALSLGGLVGVLLSAGFVWWEVGRFAAPQVPVTVFDERKVLAAYTVGLFVGVPLAATFLLLAASLANGALPGAALFLGGIVVGTEIAQFLLVRSRYWGAGTALPFYAVSFRAGVGGILALAVVAAYFGSVSSPSAIGIGTALLMAGALVALEVAGGLLSLVRQGSAVVRRGGPLAGGIFGTVAFFLLGVGPTAGVLGAVAAPLVILGGAWLTYRGRRGMLAEVPPPAATLGPGEEDRVRAYGRSAPLRSEDAGPPRP